MIKIEVDAQRTIKDLEKYLKDRLPKIEQETQKAGLIIETQAKTWVRVDTGRLRSSIKARYKRGNKSFKTTVGTRVKYAAYVEFGTGALVSIPKGAQKAASQFKGKGLRKVNRKSKPYLIPAHEGYRQKYLQNIKNILK